ncbi:hypothetical protein X975_14166, partial [Stegodyphus mimosarum]
MTGLRESFVSILKEKINHKILVYDCIFHQDTLCQKKIFETLWNCNVIKTADTIAAKALYRCQFKEILVEMESESADILLNNKVRWLSRQNVSFSSY